MPNAARFLLVAGLWGMTAAAQNSLLPREIADGWLLLFDGQTLFGWENHGDANWRVENGALVADAGRGAWLGTAARFSDFELQLEFRAAANTANSGVFLRTAREGVPERTGYEVQIWDFNRRGFFTGSILFHFPADPPVKITPQQWTPLSMTAEGDHFLVTYNGRKVAEGRDSKTAIGHIGLQYLPGPRMEFRNIKLRPLGLKPLFNGQDLRGWTKLARPEPAKVPPEWSVRDGMIHVEHGPGELESEGTWDNFVLQLAVRTNTQRPDLHPNSGVFFRGDKGGYWTGYESQIRNEYKDGDRGSPVDFGTGGLYYYQTARRVVSSDNEFFTKTIIADGREFQIWVNGIQTVSHRDAREEAPNSRKGARLAGGPIGLQAHDPTTNLDFKDIRLAALPAGAKD